MSLNKNNQIYIPSCFFRVGRRSAFVDNAASGGIFLDYDLKSNRLEKKAYTHAGNGGNSYYEHPDTNFVFHNQNLPYPEKVRSLVYKAAQLFPDLPLIGWDIGYTEEGPVLIEGNSNPSLLIMQITQKGLNKNTSYIEHFKDINLGN